MDQQLMAVIGATITLGATLFGSSRMLRKSMERMDMRFESTVAALRADMKDIEGRLRADAKASEGRLRAEVTASEGRLRAEVTASEGRLRAEVKASEGRLEGAIAVLRDDVKERDDKLEHAISGLRDEMTTGFMNVGERVSKVEGVVEGLFPGVRTQPRATPRQGAA